MSTGGSLVQNTWPGPDQANNGHNMSTRDTHTPRCTDCLTPLRQPLILSQNDRNGTFELFKIYTSVVYTKIKQLATKLRFILIKMQNNYVDRFIHCFFKQTSRSLLMVVSIVLSYLRCLSDKNLWCHEKCQNGYLTGFMGWPESNIWEAANVDDNTWLNANVGQGFTGSGRTNERKRGVFKLVVSVKFF